MKFNTCYHPTKRVYIFLDSSLDLINSVTLELKLKAIKIGLENMFSDSRIESWLWR